MSDGSNNMDATVWAAEHGASNPDLGSDRVSDDSPANVGHRFRIHGRLPQDEQEPPIHPEPGMKLDPEFLRRMVARESEVDIHDVRFQVQQRDSVQDILMEGSVNDPGARQELEALLSRIPGVRNIENRLRVQSA